MKLVSWNVNGLRACLTKGFQEVFDTLDADIFCLQETKMQPGQADINAPDYHIYYNSAEKKGYSGVAVFAKEKPLHVTYGIGVDEHDHEGRVITLEYADFFLVTVYTPNAQRELARLAYRMQWEDAFRAYLKELDSKKPVIVCGDMNVAHQEIDLKNPQSNHESAGFSDAERAKFGELLEAGFTDTFRYFYPDKPGAYSWWSYMYQARSRNTGWRIDYFLVSDRLKENLTDAAILSDIMGSDHCPVTLELTV